MSSNITHGSRNPSPNSPDRSSFTCDSCGGSAPVTTPDGRQRQHCPVCLRSRHDAPSRDDGAECGARMGPIAVAAPRTGGWLLIQRCLDCAHLACHPVAGDDNELILMRMAVRPLAEPPFPLEPFGIL
ncbi:RNHCP domain-containing protein [Leucobacter allii]|uniref:RNHCP domain-containing protein n=1 Tax=Leucobacter allii TaxID=2932247 RepID=UPI001FD5ECC2|nr:RNHCP domain-containing protein [Leucobacter allii]UOR02572.1 RNHCP domain-containing protein [Leucobacter allii]